MLQNCQHSTHLIIWVNFKWIFNAENTDSFGGYFHSSSNLVNFLKYFKLKPLKLTQISNYSSIDTMTWRHIWNASITAQFHSVQVSPLIYIIVPVDPSACTIIIRSWLIDQFSSGEYAELSNYYALNVNFPW